MKNTIILTVSILFLFIFIGKPEITFKPFTFKLTGWVQMLGYIFLILAIILIPYKEKREYYEKGLKEGSEMTIEILNKHLTPKQKESI